MNDDLIDTDRLWRAYQVSMRADTAGMGEMLLELNSPISLDQRAMVLDKPEPRKGIVNHKIDLAPK